MLSTRLPGKVLADISGKPMLWHVVHRASRANLVDQVVVATSVDRDDQPIVDFCNAEGIEYFRGSLEDVLDRYYQTARKFGPETIIRITADCPLMDPEVIDKVLETYNGSSVDYASNIIDPSYPDGLDGEVFSFEALERTWQEARRQSEREHVTTFMKVPGRMKTSNVAYKEDLSSLRWTVDEPEDLEFVRVVFRHLDSLDFGMIDVLDLLDRHPEIAEINTGITRNEGLKKSLRNDRFVESGP